MNIQPTEYDMLISDEQGLLVEIQDHKASLIDLEQELQFTRNKLQCILRAVPDTAQISIYA